ncbi:hypothetical protein CEXT_663251 [Caerostris extrusa]|uniref:Ribosomal protein S14 n=1 Tax=Caerostris extrusa TaxID=172846 RepID=A0AAV4X5Y5_CAEEX|nr:hypothetical protein CEXT_663251 [Caerostris extrusa]
MAKKKYLRSKPCKKINQTPKRRNRDFIFNHSSIQLMVDGHVLNSITMTSFIFLSVYHACIFPKRTCEGFSTGHASSYILPVCMAIGHRGIDEFLGQESDCRKIPMQKHRVLDLSSLQELSHSVFRFFYASF